MRIQNLMFNRYIREETIPHSAKAQESHMKILAGLILKNKNAPSVEARIPTIVVAR
jgi:hypothetical protein